MSDIIDLWRVVFCAPFHISFEDLKYLAWFFCALGIPVVVGVVCISYILKLFGV